MKGLTARLLKQLCCNHDYGFVRNIYGDEIIFAVNWNRSIWKCKKCGRVKLKSNLNYSAPKIEGYAQQQN